MKELKNTVVHLPTKEEFDEYMEMRKKAGWVILKNPEIWELFKKNSCVSVRNEYCYDEINFYKLHGYTILTLDELKKKQALTELTEESQKCGLYENPKATDSIKITSDYVDVNGKRYIAVEELQDFINNK